MFGKLKEKLKGALSIFSKKAEEQAEEKTIEIEVVKEKKQPTILKAEQPQPAAKKKEQHEKHHPTQKVPEKEAKKKKLQAVKPQQELHKQTKQEPTIQEKAILSEEELEELKSFEKKKQPAVDAELHKVEQQELRAEQELLQTAAKIEPVEPEEKKSFFNRFKETFSKKDKKEKTDEKDQADQKDKAEKKPTIHKETTPTVKEEISAQHQQRQQDQQYQQDQTHTILETELIEKHKQGFFEKIKQAVTTKTITTEKFEELFWDLEVVLLEHNVSVEVIEKIKDDLKNELVNKPLPRDVPSKIEDTLRKTMLSILSVEKIEVLKRIKAGNKPYIIAFFGINGAGKTTSIAKLTHYLQANGYSVVLAACDTFRAAAIQQLEEHAQKLGVRIIKQDYGADAAAVAFDAVKFAEKNKIDVVLIDTAGRLHSNTNLMGELAKIIKVTKPHLKIFVGESITGNDCIEQARQFNTLVELDGCILTKADVDEKGGAPLSIAYTIKKPIWFMGVGQRYEDLEEFEPQKIVERLGL